MLQSKLNYSPVKHQVMTENIDWKFMTDLSLAQSKELVGRDECFTKVV